MIFKGFYNLGCTCLWSGHTGLLTVHWNVLHTFTSYAFIYAFASAWSIPIYPTRSRANIVFSWLSSATTDVFSCSSPKALCSYLCYRAHYITLKLVGYKSVFPLLPGVLQDKIHAWFIFVALLAASTMPDTW